jgi:hypothetical protein
MTDFCAEGSKGCGAGYLPLLPPTRGRLRRTRTFSTINEAQIYALLVISELPSGEEFTVNGLFGDVAVRGRDARVNAALLNQARKQRLISCVGWTQRDQESRNRGAAALWRRL